MTVLHTKFQHYSSTPETGYNGPSVATKGAFTLIYMGVRIDELVVHFGPVIMS